MGHRFGRQKDGGEKNPWLVRIKNLEVDLVTMLTKEEVFETYENLNFCLHCH